MTLGGCPSTTVTETKGPKCGLGVRSCMCPFSVDAMPGPNSLYDPKGAPKLPNEDFRLSVLQSYNILDTEPEARFDRLTQLAALIFKAKASLVTLVDKDRVWFKSNVGFEGCDEVPRNNSFCQFVTLPSSEPSLIVLDTSKDGRFKGNPLVTGDPHIRFWAGVPLRSQGGFVLGSFCIVDYEPRETFSKQDQELLIALAKLATQEIEKHSQAVEMQRLQHMKFEEDKRGLLQAIDAFDEGLVLCNVSQKGQPIVFVNEGWEKITGYSAQESLGQHCGTLLQGPLTSVESKRAIMAACREGKTASVEILNYRKDGTPFWNWLRIRPVVGPAFEGAIRDGANGGDRYYFGILSDCTLRKEKELELEAIRLREMEAEASVRAKRSFVANISHELRTPMNAILACSQLLTDMPSLTDDQRELSRMIQGSGQQLLRLINDILDFSKMDAGKMELKCAEFNLWGCLDYCIEMLAMRCEAKGLDLSYNMDDSVPDWIWADEVRLSQILTNLLSNASKFTESGGEVEVSVTAKPARRRTSSDSPEGSLSPQNPSLPKECAHLPEYEIIFSVRDTGIGIPRAFQEVLFDAFTQCDNSRTKKYEGTGLGLAISRDLAERMGGRMWVESEEGKGSTFYVAVLARGSMQESAGVSLSPEQANYRAPTPLTRKRALLVGNRKSFQSMVGSMLGAWGVEVTVAESPEDLLSLPGFSGRPKSAAKRRLRVEVAEPGPRFDAVIVDGFVPESRSLGSGLGSGNFGARIANGNLGENGIPEEGSQEATELANLGCQLSTVVPTFLLTSKDGRSRFDPSSKAMEDVVCLSRPVRINPFYSALLQALTQQHSLSPLTTPRSLLDVMSSVSTATGDESLQVLVVEDNKVNQRVLHKVLRSLNYEKIRTAGNGREVLKLLRERPADVVLMDVQMPEMDGLTATTRIKADFPEEEQPLVIALTADVGNDIEKECQEAGMISYLSKPVRKAKLERLLAKCGYYKQHPSERKSLKWIDAT